MHCRGYRTRAVHSWGISVWVPAARRRQRRLGRQFDFRFDLLLDRRLDRQLTTIRHEDEDIRDRLARRRGGQNHIPAYVTALGVQFADRRNRCHTGLDLKASQLLQLAQQQQRIGARTQEIGPGAKADVPVENWAPRIRGRGQLRRGRRLGWARFRLSGQLPHLQQDLGGNRAVRLAPAGGFIQHRFNLIERR